MQNFAKFSIALAIPLVVIGCAPNYATMPAEQLVTHVRSSSSEFDANTLTYLPPISSRMDRGLLGSYETIEATLGYSTDKTTGQKRYALVVKIDYNDYEWHFYESAEYKGGATAPLLGTPRRKVQGCQAYKTLGTRCDYTEIVVIQLDDKYVLDHLSGFSIRVSSRSGKHNIVSLPGNYVLALRLQLNKLNEEALKSVPGPTSQNSPPVTNLGNAGYTASDPTPKMLELARQYADENGCGSTENVVTRQLGSRNIFEFGCTKQKITVSCDFRSIDAGLTNKQLLGRARCRWWDS
jgi:hypothetical protein